MPNIRAPKVEIKELRDDFVKFVLSDTDTSVANALRRVMIAEVPVMAMDLITIYQNSSALQDEFLAHRLGLIPLRTVPGADFEFNFDCDCEDHCQKCSVTLTLDASYEEMAKHRTEEDEKDTPIVVTSAHLRCQDTRVDPVKFTASDDLDHIQDTGITIAKLSKGQCIQLTAIAKKGIGKEHAKWSPCAVATYQFDPIVTVNKEEADKLSVEQREQLCASCPTKVYEMDRLGHLVVKNPEMCMYCLDCVYLAESFKARKEDTNAVSVRHSEDRFIFSVETNGSMSAEDVVIQGLEVISKKLQMLRTELMQIRDLAAA